MVYRKSIPISGNPRGSGPRRLTPLRGDDLRLVEAGGGTALDGGRGTEVAVVFFFFAAK